MSKIIVDQIAKNGGATLTIPAADGTAANQPVVTNGAGVLAFSPLGMPTADSTANKAVVTDGSGQLAFSPLALPAADGTSGQNIATDGAGQLSFVAAPSNGINDDSPFYGSVVSSSARENVYSTGEWSSSGPWTTHYMNTMENNSSAVQSWNCFLGDGHPDGTSNHFYVGDQDGQRQREPMYANNKRLGHKSRDFYYHDNASTGNNYPGVTWRVMPIRNTSSAAITVTLNAYASIGTNNYGGGCMSVFKPSGAGAAAGTTVSYANATGGTWTNIATHQSNDDFRNFTGTTVVPANTTVLIMLISCHRYSTTYRFKDTNYFYNLHTTFTNAGIKCDERMMKALEQGRSPSNAQATSSPHELYNWSATALGDR